MARTHEPIVLRREELPDEAVVIVRGGLMAAETVRRTAAGSHDTYGFLGVSVEAALDVDWEELCRTSPRIAGRYPKVRLSTAGRVRGAGFPLLPTDDRPHYDVVLPDLGDGTVNRLIGSFGDPIDSPGRPGRAQVEEYPQ